MSNLDKNKVFFGLLHYIFTEQPNVNWAFKTSLVNFTGINETMNQKKYKNDSISNDIITYVKEVKPYHVQFNHYIEKYSSKDDECKIKVSDSIFPTIKVRYDNVAIKPSIKYIVYTYAYSEEDLKNTNIYKIKSNKEIYYLNLTEKVIYYLNHINDNEYEWIYKYSVTDNDLIYVEKNNILGKIKLVINDEDEEINKLVELSNEELIKYENESAANRIFLYKTHDLDLIKEYVNGNFKGLHIDGSDFNIDRFGYDAFLYDLKRYEEPVKTIAYCLGIVNDNFKYIPIGTDTFIIPNLNNIIKITSSKEGEIKDYSKEGNSENETIITLFYKTLKDELITIKYKDNSNNTITKKYKTNMFIESDDEGFTRKFFDETNKIDGIYELDLPPTSINYNKISVSIEKPNGYRFPIYENQDYIVDGNKIFVSYFNKIWQSNHTYNKNNIIIYDNKFYRCTEKYKSENIKNFEENKQYNVNDLINHNNLIYKCIEEHISTEIFNQSKWQKQPINSNYWENISLENWKIYISVADMSLLYDKIYTWEDVYGISNNRTTWENYYKNHGLIQNIDGNDFLNPHYEKERPDELCVLYPQNTLMIYSQKDNGLKSLFSFDYKNIQNQVKTLKSATLLEPLKIGDSIIKINKNIFKNPYKDKNGDMIPGRILINSEIIEYYELIENDDKSVILQKLRRGTNGTFMGEYYGIETPVYSFGNTKEIPLELINSYYFVNDINVLSFTINGYYKNKNKLKVFKTNNIQLLSDITQYSTEFKISDNGINLPSYNIFIYNNESYSFNKNKTILYITENDNIKEEINLDKEYNIHNINKEFNENSIRIELVKGYLYIDNTKITFNTIEREQSSSNYIIKDFDNLFGKEFYANDYPYIPSNKFIEVDPNNYEIYNEKYENYDNDRTKEHNYIIFNESPNLGECIIIENHSKEIFN